MRIEQCRVGELDALEVSDRGLSAVVVPGLGGKIASIVWEGRDVLAANPRKALRAARYAAPYAEFDASGFDECIPTIGPCVYPDEPWQGIDVPDHGEVWSIPWSYEVSPDRLRLWTDGVRFPYTFEKSIEIQSEGAIRFHYALTNRASVPLRFLWSAHPLLAIRPGMRIHLPSGVSVKVDWSKGDRLGELLTAHPWPITQDRSGQDVDLSLILDADTGLVDKLYTNRLTDGWCAVHDPTDGYYVAMLFSPEAIPYVGLAIILGGWPLDEPGYYTLGLEPCNGYPDRLDLAIAQGDCPVAPPGKRLNWQFDLHIGRCADIPEEIARLRGDGAVA